MGKKIASPLSSVHVFLDASKEKMCGYDLLRTKIYDFFPYDEKINDISYQCFGNTILMIITAKNSMSCWSYVPAVVKSMKDGMAIFSCAEYFFLIEKEKGLILDFHYEAADKYFEFAKYVKSKKAETMEFIQFYGDNNNMNNHSWKIVRVEKLKTLRNEMNGAGIGRKLVISLIFCILILFKYECSLKMKLSECESILSNLRDDYISLEKRVTEKGRDESNFVCVNLSYILKELLKSDPFIYISKLKIDGLYFELEGECCSAIAITSVLNKGEKFADLQLGTVIALPNGKEKISLKGRIHEIE